MILLDTSIFIFLFKEKDKFKSLFEALPNENYAISVISIAEIELGFSLFKSIKKREQVNEFWNYIKNCDVTIIPVSTDVVKIYAQIQSVLMGEGKQLSHFDGLIAATAIFYKYKLATKDADFKRIKGLKLVLV